jgi:glutamate-1-semialdehyde aminotransferase
MRHEVIEASFEVRWLAPVWVRVGNGMPEIVRGPKDALEQLQYRWPSLQGGSYRQAKLKCMAALSKRGLCEEARETFIRASIEAKMLD